MERTRNCINTTNGCLRDVELFVVRFVQKSCTHLEHNGLEIGCLVDSPLHERHCHPSFSLLFLRTTSFKEYEKEHKRVEELLWKKSEDACCAEGVSTSCSATRKSAMNGTWLKRSTGQANSSISAILALNRESIQGQDNSKATIHGYEATVSSIMSNNDVSKMNDDVKVESKKVYRFTHFSN